jgi:UDP-2-acetamido-3-amino-2,3-dideoxy-glucuronate N-acetyltransferase
VLTANAPPFSLVIGVPARQIGWMCRCGERLQVSGGAAWCSACGRGYRSDGRTLTEA